MGRFLLAWVVAASLAGSVAQARQAPAPAAASTSATVTPAVAPAAAPAVTPAAPVPPQAIAAGPAAGSLIQTIFALCLVLALLAALAWCMKRYGPKAQAGAARVKLVGALSLGGRERIMVVEVGDQWIVVGASPGRVNALATMPRQPGIAETPPGATLLPHQPSASSFAAWLKQTIDNRHAK